MKMFSLCHKDSWNCTLFDCFTHFAGISSSLTRVSSCGSVDSDIETTTLIRKHIGLHEGDSPWRGVREANISDHFTFFLTCSVRACGVIPQYAPTVALARRQKRLKCTRWYLQCTRMATKKAPIF